MRLALPMLTILEMTIWLRPVAKKMTPNAPPFILLCMRFLFGQAGCLAILLERMSANLTPQTQNSLCGVSCYLVGIRSGRIIR